MPRLVIVTGREGAGKSTLIRALLPHTPQEWRDRVDLADPEDVTIRQADADYRYLGIDTTRLDVAQTVHLVRTAIPEIYRG